MRRQSFHSNPKPKINPSVTSNYTTNSISTTHTTSADWCTRIPPRNLLLGRACRVKASCDQSDAPKCASTGRERSQPSTANHSYAPTQNRWGIPPGRASDALIFGATRAQPRHQSGLVWSEIPLGLPANSIGFHFKFHWISFWIPLEFSGDFHWWLLRLTAPF